jgi:AraC family transcriptional regulator
MQASEIGWSNGWVRAIDATPGGQAFLAPWLLVGMAQGEPHDVAFRFDGGRTHRLTLHPGDLQVVPAGLSHEVEWPKCRFGLVGLAPHLLDEAREAGAPRRAPDDPRLRLRDPLVEALVQALVAEARDYASAPMAWRALYRDALARALVAQLTAGRPLLGGTPPGGGRQRLGRERLRRTIDFIEAHLDAPLPLDALAAAAGLSPFHFARVFRDAVGQTPARYVAARRLRRAQDLLAEGRLSHDEIAHRCGMGDARRLRDALRRRLHATPLSTLD